MILLVLLQEWSIKFYIRVTSISKVKSDVIIDDEVRVTYDCVIKIT